MTERRASDAGLSLVEVLVSLAIFAVIGVAGLAILNTVARTGERTEGRLERLSEIDRAFLVIRRDLAQIAPSGVELGPKQLRFLRLGADYSVGLAFRLEDAILIRRVDTAASGPVDQRLLDGTMSMEWRLMDGSRTWHGVWPPAGGTPPGRPVAAELTLELMGDITGRPDLITRLIPLPAGQGR